MHPKGFTAVMHLFVVQLYHSQQLTADHFTHLCMTYQVFVLGFMGFIIHF
jgi:hypothetical protein